MSIDAQKIDAIREESWDILNWLDREQEAQKKGEGMPPLQLIANVRHRVAQISGLTDRANW